MACRFPTPSGNVQASPRGLNQFDVEFVSRLLAGTDGRAFTRPDWNRAEQAAHATAIEAARHKAANAQRETARTPNPRPSGQVAPADTLTPHQMLVRSDLISYFALGGAVLGLAIGVANCHR